MDLFGVGQAVDVIFMTPKDIERYGDAIGLIIEPALREGRVIYGTRALDFPPDDLLDSEELGAMKQRGKAWKKANALKDFRDCNKRG